MTIPTNKKRVLLTLDRSMNERLDSRAADGRVRKSVIVSIALANYLDTLDAEAEPYARIWLDERKLLRESAQ